MSEAWHTDLDRLIERLADRLRQRGAKYPDVAAAALAARGREGLTVDEWSTATGVERRRITEIEGGDRDIDVAFGRVVGLERSRRIGET